MSRIISVEHASYINNNISIYTKNKVGQYAKFLRTNPLFVTYYSVNEQMSTADTGTGNIVTDLGPNSPIRYNKIENVPIFNVPELKPNINYDETGYDIDIDLSDLTILPNTIKPKPGDFLLIAIPGVREFLFKIDSFAYNTIQSNDFYLCDAKLKRTEMYGLEEKYLSMLIVETYITIFDNIGTNDRCFIRKTDVDYVNSIIDLTNTLKAFYKNNFYEFETNAFLRMPDIMPLNLSNVKIYDLYVEAFIMRSEIYYEPYEEETIALAPSDAPQIDFENIFAQTLYGAVLKKRKEFLRPYSYVFEFPISKRNSIFSILGRDIRSNVLMMSRVDLRPIPTEVPIPPPPEPKRLIDFSFLDKPTDPDITDPDITDPDVTDPEVPTDPDVTDPDPDITDPDITDPEVPTDPDPDVTDPEVPIDPPTTRIVDLPQIFVMQYKTEFNTLTGRVDAVLLEEYFPSEFINQILNGSIDTDYYFHLIIFNYLNDIEMEYDREEIISLLDSGSLNYKYLPMIIYILNDSINRYFKAENVMLQNSFYK